MAGRWVSHTVALFGLGLIGKSIYDQLAVGAAAPQIASYPFSWSEEKAWPLQVEAIRMAINRRTSAATDNNHLVDVVWAAGRAGFSASQHDLQRETAAFKTVLSICSDLARQSKERTLRFHFLSSAGGLFEGQRCIDHLSVPRALRPYSAAKLEQETLLAALLPACSLYIYYPSSVYGHCGFGQRVGVVTALIRAAITNSVATIYGGSDTLRDYVFVDDVARYIGEKISFQSASGRFFLASGKPTAMTEMITLVERALQRRIYVVFQSRSDNRDHNSYRQSALPLGWRTTPIDVGIQRTALKLREELYRRRSSLIGV